MSETEVENSVKNWTGPKEAEYAALLNDLAQLKLSTVNCCGFLWPSVIACAVSDHRNFITCRGRQQKPSNFSGKRLRFLKKASSRGQMQA